MRDYLDRGYDRAVWLDADVLVFAPQLLKIDTQSGYAFSHEVVLGELPDGRIHISAPSINNAAMVFEKNHPMLEFYRFATEAILRNAPPGEIARTAVGPQFLRALNGAMPIERLTSVGLFTPRLMMDIANGGPDFHLCAAYARNCSPPPAPPPLSFFSSFISTIPLPTGSHPLLKTPQKRPAKTGKILNCYFLSSPRLQMLCYKNNPQTG